MTDLHLDPDLSDVPLDAVIATAALATRAVHTSDRQAESRAFARIADALVRDPGSTVSLVVELALSLCRAGSAGLSVIESEGTDSDPIVRWQQVSGAYGAEIGRSFGFREVPCSAIVSEAGPQLMVSPHRHFKALRNLHVPCSEFLGVAIPTTGTTPATLWVARHDSDTPFDAEDARVLSALAAFTAAALRISGHPRGRSASDRSILTTEQLQRRLARAQEEERRRIARDLHDSVGQLLAGLMLSVKAVSELPSLSPQVAQRLADLQRIAESLDREMHGLALRLRPASIDDRGLTRALEQLVTDWTSATSVPVDFQTTGDLDRIYQDVEAVLYRVVQEALTNVAKHANATSVSVVGGRQEDFVWVVVEDDGVGFDTDDVRGGRLGLTGMRERVALAGGELTIESSTSAGTTIIARIPMT